MSVKSSTELMLYVVLTMPTLNKAYLFIYLFIAVEISFLSGRCGQCVRPIKHLPDLHFLFTTSTELHTIKWFVYSFN